MIKRVLTCGSFRVLAVLVIGTLVFSACQTASKKNHLTTGNQFARDGLLREATDAYKKALAQSADNVAAHRNIGMVYVKLGNYPMAVKHLEKAMRRYENDFDANYYLGEAYRAQDRYAQAIFRYQKALQIRSDDPRALKPLAWSFFKIRYYSEAIITARKLRKVAPGDDQVGIITTRTLLKLKRPKEALSVLRSSKKRIERKSVPYYNSVEGDILYELRDLKGATRAYRNALKDEPLLAGALLGLGKCMMDRNKTKRAITYLERAVRIRPRLTEGHFMLGKAYEKIDRQKSLRYYQYFRKQASADPEFLGLMDEVRKRIGALQGRGRKTR